VIDRAEALDKQRRKMLTSLLLNSGLDQAVVLATSEEAPPSIVPQGVKFLSLVEGIKPGETLASTAAQLCSCCAEHCDLRIGPLGFTLTCRQTGNLAHG